MKINNFSDFCAELRGSGFSLGSGDKGIYAIVPYTWDEELAPDNPIRWHTGDPETDPWEWRMRVLEECDDIAYSKLFFGTSGYITKEWYPYFFAVRRRGETFDEAYMNGTVSQMTARLYNAVVDAGETPLHELKRIAGITKEESSKFERALTELQARMFLTMCGRTQKKNALGIGYGWNSTVFTTVEDFWQKRGYEIEERPPEEAFERIRAQVLKLNPSAEKRKIDKFIKG